MDSALFGQLTIFHAIAAEGGVSAAARRLGIGVPAVSKSLKALETALGLPLFNRTTRRLEITEAGQTLLANSAEAMQSLSYAVESVLELGQIPSGPLRITVARFAYQAILKPFLAEFCETYPEIRLEISVNDGTIDIIERGFDFGVRFGDRLEEGMVARRLMAPFREGMYVSESYLERYGRPETPQDLARHHLIAYRYVTANRILPLILNKDGEDLTVDMPVSITVNDIQLMADATRQGLGIGRFFEPTHSRLPDASRFIPIMEPYWRAYPAVYLYFPQNSQKAKRVRALIDFLAGRQNRIEAWRN